MSTPLNVRAAVRTVRRPVGIIALSLCAGVGAAWAVTAQISPSYEARASLMVTAYTQDQPAEEDRTSRGDEAPETTYDPGLSQATVRTVARLAESARIGQATSVQAGLRAGEVVGHIRADYEPGVQIITLTTVATTAHKAAAMANAASTVLRQQVASGELLGRPGMLYAQPLDRATLPEVPTTPKPLLNLLLGGLLGLFAGIGFLSLRNTLDDTLRSTDQIESELQVGILATLPQMRRRYRRDGAMRALRRRQVAASVRAAVAALAPFTDTPDRRILITSAYRDDGKTFVSALLSLALAEQYYRVTLIEGDLRKPTLGDHFPGRSEYKLQELLPDPEPLLSSPGPLRTVPADAAEPEISRSLFRSPAFRGLLAATRNHSDILVVNGPPVLAGADVAALSEECDAAILVVRAGTTGAADARRAVQVLRRLDLPIAGVVVVDAIDAGRRVRRVDDVSYGIASLGTHAPAPAPVGAPKHAYAEPEPGRGRPTAGLDDPTLTIRR
ncbi:hypothetical protein [Actinopolymorpha pittospori]